MSNCYVWGGVGLDSKTYTFSACATNPTWGAAAGYPGYFAPYDNGVQISGPWATSAGSITLVTSESQFSSARNGNGGNQGSCDGCINNPPPSVQYDCVNGGCIKKSVYNTPGLYESLDDCQLACGTGCSGKCISNADWAQIEGLSNQLKNRNCS